MYAGRAIEPAWRGFLSLRDPTGASHAVGPPERLCRRHDIRHGLQRPGGLVEVQSVADQLAVAQDDVAPGGMGPTVVDFTSDFLDFSHTNNRELSFYFLSSGKF